MLKRIISWLFNLSSTKEEIKQIGNAIQSNTATSIIPTAEESLVARNEVVKQQAWFSRKNSLAECFLDEPPSIINGDGTVYYGAGDKRNTYDPKAKKWVEDYDGTWIELGGSGHTEAVKSKTAEELLIEDDPNDDEITKMTKKLWRESIEKTATYNSGM